LQGRGAVALHEEDDERRGRDGPQVLALLRDGLGRRDLPRVLERHVAVGHVHGAAHEQPHAAAEAAAAERDLVQPPAEAVHGPREAAHAAADDDAKEVTEALRDDEVAHGHR
jgi:hypothetical protein